MRNEKNKLLTTCKKLKKRKTNKEGRKGGGRKRKILCELYNGSQNVHDL